ncbi:hypothetical protein [Sphingomonas cavernae]|uniref:Uncharacterized protein n=1 Tax=Sphingomonas cavernae TaxID=2320861 RepID=A0A418WR47_9SPHN|nr:hypothetical protein [Sphingomonas cavernae]RJF93676.1 hypothetical protein D3876_05075 [Sphingomonas cavernae]
MPHDPSSLRFLCPLLLPLGIAALALPAAAQTPPSKPQTAEDAAKSIVTDPLEDTNIQGKKIPAALSRIGDNPYSRSGTQSCQAIASAVTELDGALGPDFDEPPASGPSTDAKAISTAKDVAFGFIPGRGLIREVSGANKAEQRYNHAVYAGLARRAFLKGMGAQRGCKAPAAPRS